MHLQCSVCSRYFLMYHQRGFRNIGFTAHQRRFTTKELKNTEQRKEVQRHGLPKCRSLLPAPILLLLPKQDLSCVYDKALSTAHSKLHDSISMYVHIKETSHPKLLPHP
ncbi:hypothetical protein BDF14DRAFT_23200 [Spinellus fusiger]|nr:hypothetical protein BDF14DRAFT_23200 [Spinellus fusiger]